MVFEHACGAEDEIYRGDSFQLVGDPADALVIVLLPKDFTIKQHKALDVRMAELGTIDYTSNKVTESNGVLSLIQGMF
jgi:hypothetical protein